MVYPPFFHKLLGIAESVAEPTAYQLLGIDPRVFVPALVRPALNERRKRLRQNIPGPQFIPIVSLFEQELERAAAVLLDPAERQAYDERLRREAREAKLKRERAKRQRMIRAARQSVGKAVNRDGTLDDAKRPALAGQLRKLGLEEGSVQSILATTPKPTWSVPPAEAREFFGTAVDLAISRGLLTGDDERRLTELAKNLSIASEAATEILEQQLRAKGAQRGEHEVDFLRAQFEREVRALFRGGPASLSERANLLALATARGLPEWVASEVMRQCLPPETQGASVVGEEIAGADMAEDEAELEVPPLDETPAVAADAGSPYEARGEPEGGTVPPEQQPVTGADIVEAEVLPTDEATGAQGYEREQAMPEEEPRPTTLSRTARRVWAVAPPLVAIGIFVALIVFYGPRLLEREEGPKVRHGVSPSTATTPAPATIAPAPPSPHPRPVRPSTPTPSRRSTTPAAPATSTPPAHRAGEPPVATTPPPPRPSPPMRDLVAAVRRQLRYSSTTVNDELLADLALTMLAWCDAASRFAGERNVWSRELATLTAQRNRVRYLTSKVSLPEAGPAGGGAPAAGAPRLDRQRLGELRKELLSTSRAIQYRAIEELRVADDAEAADLLVSRLRTTAEKAPASMSAADARRASRILRALGSMSAPALPEKLIQMLPRCRNSIVAFQISKTLEGLVKARVGGHAFSLYARVYERDRTLCRTHTLKDRETSARAWRATVDRIEARLPGLRQPFPHAQPRPTPRRGGPRTPPTPPAWQPDATKLKLLAAVQYYARQAADVLKDHKRGVATSGRGRSLPPTRSILAPDNVGEELLSSLDDIVNELNRLVREHPKGKKHSLEAEMVAKEKKVRTLASETTLQKAAVSLDAAASLLELLVKASDPAGDLKARLEGIRKERRKASAAAANAIHEMRESCFFGLVFWRLLVQ